MISRVSTFNLQPMVELLLAHRARVAFSTFRTEVPLPTHLPVYKNVPRTHGCSSRCVNSYQHGASAQDQIDRILDRVHSLDVIELRCISEGSLVIDKFKASPAEHHNWVDKSVAIFVVSSTIPKTNVLS
jgi:hypothetical protein